MIPKIIHYCWFGHSPKPTLAKKCIKSWKKYCPHYEIIEWNDSNFDISSCPLYVRQAYDAQKWAFVTDYIRLKVVYDHGGIYMDTDVELKKNLDSLLIYQGYFGFEDGVHINTGLGFGAVKGLPILQEIMDDYKGTSFIMEDGSYNTEVCPTRNTKVLLRHGLNQNDKMQTLEEDILILPSIILCPLSYETGKIRRSRQTISIHHFAESWKGQQERDAHRKRIKKIRCEELAYLPNRVGMKLLGSHRYQQLKKFLKG